MSILGNIIWLIAGGFVCGIGWIIAGVLLCCTIIGIPFGFQLFKYAGLVFCPFGKKIVSNGQITSILLNIFWIIVSGIELAVFHFIIGCLLFITIIGIPFAKQHFKLATLALIPFGSTVVPA